MSFSIKTIRVTIVLQKDYFSDGNNTVTIEGVPIAANIIKSGGNDKNRAEITVENLLMDTVQQITALSFRRLQSFNNYIKVEAGNRGAVLDTVFSGEISSAVPKIDNDGVLSLAITALTGYYPALKPSAPVSVAPDTEIERLMQQFAKDAGYEFKNNGVTGSVKNCVFVGSPVAKARALARQTGIDLLIDDGVFKIQPMTPPMPSEVPLLRKESGLFGYPSFSNDGVECVSLFNPIFEVGGYFRLESVLPQATATWQIVRLEHKLESNVPSGGMWETHLSGVLPGGTGNV